MAKNDVDYSKSKDIQKVPFAEQILTRMKPYVDKYMAESASVGIGMFNEYLDDLEPLKVTKQRVIDIQDDLREWTADQTERQERLAIAEQEKDKQEAEEQHEEKIAEKDETEKLVADLQQALNREMSEEKQEKTKEGKDKKWTWWQELLMNLFLMLVLGGDKLVTFFKETLPKWIQDFKNFMFENFPILGSIADTIHKVVTNVIHPIKQGLNKLWGILGKVWDVIGKVWDKTVEIVSWIPKWIKNKKAVKGKGGAASVSGGGIEGGSAGVRGVESELFDAEGNIVSGGSDDFIEPSSVESTSPLTSQTEGQESFVEEPGSSVNDYIGSAGDFSGDGLDPLTQQTLPSSSTSVVINQTEVTVHTDNNRIFSSF